MKNKRNELLGTLASTIVFGFAFYGNYTTADDVAYYIFGTVLLSMYFIFLFLVWAEFEVER